MNLLTKAKNYIRANNKSKLYPCIDLRNTNLEPLQAYYEHNNKPCIINTLPEHCRWFGASGLSYSKDSFHPYIRTLYEYQNDHHAKYEGSYLEWYWKSWKPSNLAEYFRIFNESAHPLLLNTPPNHNIFPWSPSQRIKYMQNREWLNRADYRKLCESGSNPARSCGPKPDWFGKKRFENLITIFEKIKTKGYHKHASEKLPYKDQHLVGKCLIRDGELRTLIADGQHRASSLVTLGYEKLPVIFFAQNERGPDIIRREESKYWPLVQESIFTKTQAESIYDIIFDGIPHNEVIEPKY